MKTPRVRILALVLSMGAVGVESDGRAGEPRPSPHPVQARDGAGAVASLGSFPLRFEPNRGQFDDPVRYLARGQGYALYLTREGATLSLQRQAASAADTCLAARTEPRREQAVLSMRVVGGRPDVEPVASSVVPGVTNYFVGNDPARWRTSVEGYARVLYAGVLPGVDVAYYGSGQRRLEYDLVLAPGVDPEGVVLAFDGPESVTIDGDGSLLLRLGEGGEIAQPSPVAYQLDADGTKQFVEARYETRANGVGFAVGAWDRTRGLVIDPTIVYSTYLGGSGDELVNNSFPGNDFAIGAAVDPAGEAFVAGSTQSSNFPTMNPFLGTCSSCSIFESDAFVTRLNAAGTALIYSTYLGGNSVDGAEAIAVDGSGNAYVTGETYSSNFPVISAIQATSAGVVDAFVAKLDPTGAVLMYSTYLGGVDQDAGQTIAIDSVGQAFVGGWTNSSNFPRTFTAVQPGCGSCPASVDGFFAKISQSGSLLVYSTFLGGNGVDEVSGIAVDSGGNAYLAGYTQSNNFPVFAALQGASAGNYDAFVTKLNSGGGFVYSTYLGGTQDDFGHAIALDSSGEAFVAGYTASTNFPTANALQPVNHGGAFDGFVAVVNPTGAALRYSTYLGGSQYDAARGIAVDGSGAAFVTGWTTSTDFPLASPLQSSYGGGTFDGFVTRLSASGASALYSTYLGGSGSDQAETVAVDSAANAYVVGNTTSTNFPTVAPFQPANGGGSDAFVTKLGPAPPPPPVPALGRYTPLLAMLLAVAAAVALRPARARRTTAA
jgi:hypothetical protein